MLASVQPRFTTCSCQKSWTQLTAPYASIAPRYPRNGDPQPTAARRAREKKQRGDDEQRAVGAVMVTEVDGGYRASRRSLGDSSSPMKTSPGKWKPSSAASQGSDNKTTTTAAITRAGSPGRRGANDAPTRLRRCSGEPTGDENSERRDRVHPACVEIASGRLNHGIVAHSAIAGAAAHHAPAAARQPPRERARSPRERSGSSRA